MFFMLPPFYAGGTSSFKPTSQEVIAQYKEKASAPEKYHFEADREALRTCVLAEAQKGDLIVVMGARDNSLSLYARSFCKDFQA
jgi:UDP-N-acetylmuramate--alanine ligase